MKILIDIGHPAHVHYFRNFIKIMKERGHSFLITARDKEVSQVLLKSYDIEFVSRGKGGVWFIGKFLYMIKADVQLYNLAKKIKPDIFMSFASPYAAQVSKLVRKPHIAFDDTEHAKLGHMMYVPFTDVVLTPDTFKKSFGKKQIKFKGSTELLYLTKQYYEPSDTVYDLLKIKKNEKYVVVRFVSWTATHDKGQTGLSRENKIKLVNVLSKQSKVFVSSEGGIPSEIDKFKITIPPERIHDVLYYADLLIGESGTMGTEAAFLGTPSINIATSALLVGVFKPFIESGLFHIILDCEKAIEKAFEILSNNNLSKNNNTDQFFETYDFNNFLVWLIENYPNSKEYLKEKSINLLNSGNVKEILNGN